MVEATLDAQDQLKKLKALNDKYKPYMSCMGKDFWDKCKYILLGCAVIPNPSSCLISMTCGAINNKKCKKLLPGGNSTQPAIGKVTKLPPITTPPSETTTVLEAVLKEGNPMQDVNGPAPEAQGGKASNELEPTQGAPPPPPGDGAPPPPTPGPVTQAPEPEAQQKDPESPAMQKARR